MDTADTSNSALGNQVVVGTHTPEPACSVELSERDAAAVMASAENPPAPNEAAFQAARRFLKRHGRNEISATFPEG
jgi:hypothetical protein